MLKISDVANWFFIQNCYWCCVFFVFWKWGLSRCVALKLIFNKKKLEKSLTWYWLRIRPYVIYACLYIPPIIEIVLLFRILDIFSWNRMWMDNEFWIGYMNIEHRSQFKMTNEDFSLTLLGIYVNFICCTSYHLKAMWMQCLLI